MVEVGNINFTNTEAIAICLAIMFAATAKLVFLTVRREVLDYKESLPSKIDDKEPGQSSNDLQNHPKNSEPSSNHEQTGQDEISNTIEEENIEDNRLTLRDYFPDNFFNIREYIRIDEHIDMYNDNIPRNKKAN